MKLWGLLGGIVLTTMAIVMLSTTVSHTQGTGRVTAGLVVLYGFEEGSGTTVTDVSGVGTPMNLTIANENTIAWIPGGGLTTILSSQIDSGGPATKVIDALQTTNQSTVELWVKADNLTQSDPARLLSIGGDNNLQNLVVGQDDAEYHIRLLHTDKDNKAKPRLITADSPVTTDLVHLVHTYDGTTERLYINGVQHPTIVSRTGVFSNWDSNDPLNVANEGSGDRSWIGEIHLVAIYDQALSVLDIGQNFSAGPALTQDGPAIRLDKEPTSQTVLSGGDVDFTFTIRNVGSDLLTNVVLTDPDCGPLTLTDDGTGDATLIPGEAWVYTCIVMNVINNITNSATVTAEDPTSAVISDMDTAQVIVVTNQRITTGQIVLYTFLEGTGTVVHDVGGVGIPLDLLIDNPAGTQWLNDGGLTVQASTRIGSGGAATKVIDALQATDQSSVELWVKAANLTQTGPARLLSIGGDANAQNLVVGQIGDDYEIRLLHTDKDNKAKPRLITNDAAGTTDLVHLVHTYDGTEERLYLNGVQHPTTVVRSGTYANWDLSDMLNVANEASGDRGWLGDLYLAAIFDRAMTAAEVTQNFLAGPPTSNTLPTANAGPDQTVPRNTLVTLDGSGSSDVENDPLTFNWSLTNQPAGSTAILTNPTSENPTFTPDVNGNYTIELIVNDGTDNSAPDTVVITAQNILPVADAGREWLE